MKLKKILKESAYLGELPSSKLKKMKWNPLKEKKQPIKEEYVEIMDGLEEGLSLIKDAWTDWRNGPMTEKHDIRPAQRELINYITGWMKKNIK